ncbi:MAG TPA: hypothetical protein VGQ20_07835 [Acidimicrobiales bacterium]|nr:hypothetical protein [Acidimicrobiales bacterium]
MSGRNRVEVVQIRGQDVQVGDVVNKTGAVREGWLEVVSVEQLPDGRVNIADATYQMSFTSGPLDIVWLQIVHSLHGNSHLAASLPS